MELKTLLGDDRGVSPVIGVILMVAITVILAAVIGTFVLGLGSNVGTNAPSATFNYNQQSQNLTASGASVPVVTITDQGGQAIDAKNIQVTVTGQQAFDVDSTPNTVSVFSGKITAGSSGDVALSVDPIKTADSHD